MLNLVVIWFCILNLFYRKPQGSRRFRSVLALVQHRWRVLYYRSYLCALPIGFNHSLCPCSCMFVSLLYRQRIQDSRLLYYLVREIKTWLNINHITIHTHTRMHARTHARTHTHTHTHTHTELRRCGCRSPSPSSFSSFRAAIFIRLKSLIATSLSWL